MFLFQMHLIHFYQKRKPQKAYCGLKLAIRNTICKQKVANVRELNISHQQQNSQSLLTIIASVRWALAQLLKLNVSQDFDLLYPIFACLSPSLQYCFLHFSKGSKLDEESLDIPEEKHSQNEDMAGGKEYSNQNIDSSIVDDEVSSRESNERIDTEKKPDSSSDSEGKGNFELTF